MKKLTALLLIIALLTTGLSGCSARRENEFKQNVKELKEAAAINVPLLSVLLSYEQTYIASANIEDDQHVEEITKNAMAMYNSTVEKLRAEGKNADLATIESVGDRADTIDALMKKISDDKDGQEAFPGLYRAATTLHTAHMALLGFAIAPEGPADQFKKDYEDLVKLAKDAMSQIEDQLDE